MHIEGRLVIIIAVVGTKIAKSQDLGVYICILDRWPCHTNAIKMSKVAK